MITIAVANLKGGSAKSSTCFHLGGMLAKRGGRVLMVDDDPQASLTQGFWGSTATTGLDPARTIDAVYRGSPHPGRVIHPAGVDGISILPGHYAATAWNTPTASEWGDRPLAIRRMLREVAGDYDYCFIDCPPNLHLCSFAALLAADHALVPLQPEDFGAQGMVAVTAAVDEVRAQRGDTPSLLGYLMTMFDKRLGVHVSYSGLLRDLYGARMFDVVVPYNKDFKEAVLAGKPVSHYKKSGAAFKATRELADEFEARLAACGKAVAA